jgi:hypothetical protein
MDILQPTVRYLSFLTGANNRHSLTIDERLLIAGDKYP